jgi:hypothetical protein
LLPLFYLYYAFLFLKPNKPIRPEPIRNIAGGIGVEGFEVALMMTLPLEAISISTPGVVMFDNGILVLAKV